MALSVRFQDECEEVRSPVLAGVALSPVELTRREREIVAARGQSNAQIAERLVLSVRTVESHLHHAMAKRGVASRQELPSWVNRAAVIPVPHYCGRSRPGLLPSRAWTTTRE